MKLPHTEHAFVDLRKLTDYCLDPEHPRGRHKARMFASVLGITRDEAEDLRDALLLAACNQHCRLVERDAHGERYVVESWVAGPRGRGRVRSLWIVRTGESFPRLVSCYVL
ncbi:MAG: hypothetical protein FJ290_19475 [Planctomycetes bacterium]|nr:hypothetical protein [Planctomycetota bacterium]